MARKLPIFDRCFDRKKIDAFRHLIPATYEAMEDIAGQKIDWPPNIECMTSQEIVAGKVRGKGHGLYFFDEERVKINPHMSPKGIYLNFIHENLHHAVPTASERDINDDMLPRVYEQVTGFSIDDPLPKKNAVKKRKKRRKKNPWVPEGFWDVTDKPWPDYAAKEFGGRTEGVSLYQYHRHLPDHPYYVATWEDKEFEKGYDQPVVRYRGMIFYDPWADRMIISHRDEAGRRQTSYAGFKESEDILQASVEAIEEDVTKREKRRKRETPGYTQEQLEEAFDRSVDEMELSVRTSNVLANNELWTIGQVMQISGDEFLKKRNAGRKSLKEIREGLNKFGVALRGEMPLRKEDFSPENQEVMWNIIVGMYQAPDKISKLASAYNRGMGISRDTYYEALSELERERIPGLSAKAESGIPHLVQSLWDNAEKYQDFLHSKGLPLYNPTSPHLVALMRPSDLDQEQLLIGTQHEMEHTDDPVVAQKIAMDHLIPDPEYYIKLATIERH